MTKAQAKVVVTDLVEAGYNAEALQRGGGSWVVLASTPGGTVDASAVASFASSHGVSAKVNTTEFV